MSTYKVLNRDFFLAMCNKRGIESYYSKVDFLSIIKLVNWDIADAVFGESSTDASLPIIENELISIYNQRNVPFFSIGIICKDEAKLIEKCIDNVIPYSDEIILLDTGSNDGTVDIIRGLVTKNKNLTLVEHVWKNDFSEARNALLKFIKKHEWVFFIDADERVSYIPFQELNMLLRYVSLFEIGDISFCPTINDDFGSDLLTPPRIINFRQGGKYTGRIHEQPFYDGKRMKDIIINIEMKHLGYSDEIINEKGKLKRNLKLLSLVCQEEPDNLIARYQYYRDLYVYDEAFDKALIYIEVLKVLEEILIRFNYMDVFNIVKDSYTILCDCAQTREQKDVVKSIAKKYDIFIGE